MMSVCSLLQECRASLREGKTFFCVRNVFDYWTERKHAAGSDQPVDCKKQFTSEDNFNIRSIYILYFQLFACHLRLPAFYEQAKGQSQVAFIRWPSLSDTSSLLTHHIRQLGRRPWASNYYALLAPFVSVLHMNYFAGKLAPLNVLVPANTQKLDINFAQLWWGVDQHSTGHNQQPNQHFAKEMWGEWWSHQILTSFLTPQYSKTVHFRVAFYCGQPKAHLCNVHAVIISILICHTC